VPPCSFVGFCIIVSRFFCTLNHFFFFLQNPYAVDCAHDEQTFYKYYFVILTLPCIIIFDEILLLLYLYGATAGKILNSTGHPAAAHLSLRKQGRSAIDAAL